MAKAQHISSSPTRRALAGVRGLVLCTFVFSIFANLLMLTGPLFMLQVYDRVLSSGSKETLIALFILVIALYTLMGVLDYARGRLLARVATRLRITLDGPVFATQLGTEASEATDPSAGLRHLDALQSGLFSPIALAIFDIPWTPFFIGTIFLLHPSLGWVSVAGGGILIGLTLLNNALTRRLLGTARLASAQAQLWADHAGRARAFARAQGMAAALQSRWQNAQTHATANALLASDRAGGFTALSKAARLLLQSGMLALGAWLVLRAEISAGAMIASSILLGRALAPVEQVLAQWPLIQRSVVGWRALAALPSPQNAETRGRVLPPPAPTLTFRDVTVLAPYGLAPILSRITFDVDAGQVIGVIGNSGTGKSSLAKTITGILPIAAGEVRVGGATLAQYDDTQRGRLVGYLPQDAAMFPGTIAENIARMENRFDDSAVFAAARRAGVHEMILSLRNGYSTRLNGSHDDPISGGQRQGIALARALFSDPVILVLDEPSSALDSIGTQSLTRTIRALKADGRTVIIMTHRPQSIAECDRLLVLDHGRIIADGPRDKVLDDAVQNAPLIRQSLHRVSARV